MRGCDRLGRRGTPCEPKDRGCRSTVVMNPLCLVGLDRERRGGKAGGEAGPPFRRVTGNPLVPAEERREVERREGERKRRRTGIKVRALLSVAAVFCLFATRNVSLG